MSSIDLDKEIKIIKQTTIENGHKRQLNNS